MSRRDCRTHIGGQISGPCTHLSRTSSEIVCGPVAPNAAHTQSVVINVLDARYGKAIASLTMMSRPIRDVRWCLTQCNTSNGTMLRIDTNRFRCPSLAVPSRTRWFVALYSYSSQNRNSRTIRKVQAPENLVLSPIIIVSGTSTRRDDRACLMHTYTGPLDGARGMARRTTNTTLH